jgi:membrane fusion protein, peptide pheromone/bacteriocin exporter
MPKNPIYLSLLLLVVLALLCLPLVHLPISSSSRGLVRSVQENSKLTAMVSGKVLQNKLSQNNQIINKGDTLLLLSTEQISTQSHWQQSQSTDYNAQLSDLQKLSQGQFSGLQTGQYQRELSAMQEKIGQVNTQYAWAEKELDRASQLLAQGVIAKADWDKVYYQHQGLHTQMASIKAQQMATWQSQKREVERQLRQAGSEIKRLHQEQKNYVITAPMSGRLLNYSGLQKDGFLIQGQNIGEIASDAALLTECMVSPKEIGFIHKNQQVKFQIDSYNYNQWGLLSGRVMDIDRNVSVNQQTGEAYFKVRCAMDKNFLQLKNGYKAPIGKGMTLTARFYLVERSLWQLLFDRVDDWFNPHLKSQD